MPFKTKILKIFSYWLPAIALIVGLRTAVFLVYGQNSQVAGPVRAAQQAGEPQVLGEATSIRGGAAINKRQIAQISEPAVAGVGAKSFLAFNPADGQILLQKNPGAKLGIASLTKLMTAWVAYNSADLNKSFTIKAQDVLDVSPALGLAEGDIVQALDIFNAMLVGSCNDAALALADFVSSSAQKNFVGLMNAEAKKLGMANSRFSNPLGFDSKFNYSTAEDLKILIMETEKLAAFRALGRRTAYEFAAEGEKTYSAPATNKLLSGHPDIRAIKTGYTSGAQGAMATKIKIGGNDIVIIVLGSKDREGDTLKLKEAIENSFKIE